MFKVRPEYGKKAMALQIFFSLLLMLSLIITGEHFRRWVPSLPSDLRAFYAAGEVINTHRDPFTVQPLLQVEQRLSPASSVPTIVTPVPLPPYDLAGLTLLARLKPIAAAAVFGLLTILSGVTIGFVIHRVSSVPYPLALAAVFSAVMYSASALGQIAPLAIAALSMAIWAIRREEYVLAGVSVSVAMVQPQIAIGAFVCTLLFVPRSRIAICASVVAISLITLALVPMNVLREYLTVLRLHGLSEVRFPVQYSLSWLMASLGSPPLVAFMVGGISTIATLCMSVLLVAKSKYIASKNGSVVALPAAFAVIGGSYIHEHQLILALIPGLMFLRSTRNFFDSDWAIAVLLCPFASLLTLNSPWPTYQTLPSILCTFIVSWAVIFNRGAPFGLKHSVCKATVITFSLCILFVALTVTRPELTIVIPQFTSDATANASHEWTIFTKAAAAAFQPIWFLLFVKLPTWLAVAAIGICTARNMKNDELRACKSV